MFDQAKFEEELLKIFKLWLSEPTENEEYAETINYIQSVPQYLLSKSLRTLLIKNVQQQK